MEPNIQKVCTKISDDEIQGMFQNIDRIEPFENINIINKMRYANFFFLGFITALFFILIAEIIA